MNFLLIICVAFGAVLADKALIQVTSEFLANVQPIISKCEAEANSPSNAFRNLANATIEDDASLKFVYCYLTATGHVDKEGRLIPSTFEKYFKDDKVKNDVNIVLEECKAAAGGNPMEVLRAEVACFKEKSPIYVKFGI